MSWNSGWDNIFKEYSWGRYPSEELVRFIGRKYPDRTNREQQRVLEIGCGTGANLWFLAKEGFQTFGLDGSRIAIEQARLRLQEEQVSAELQVGDAMQLPYDNVFFDLIIDVECLYANTMKDSLIILQEAKRVLKPDGRLFSITFMTGTYGDGKGVPLPDEPNTYSELTEGALKTGYGIIRFSSEEDVRKLYSLFTIEQLDYLIRSNKGRQYEIREWLISCVKS